MVIKRKRPVHIGRHNIPVVIEHTLFYGYVLRYLDAMRVRNFSEQTLRRRDSDIRRFVGWCDERAIEKPQDVTKPIIESYQRYLYYYRQTNGHALTGNTRIRYICSIKQFFKWLTQENHLLYNPASELIVPQHTPSLPVVLTQEEIEHWIAQVDITTPYGIRDRAMLEVLYSTGIRRSELCHLQVQDIALTRLTVFVHKGKGNKDRLLPLGARAGHWLALYVNQVREQLLMDIHERSLFLTDYGEPFTDGRLGCKVKTYLRCSGINAIGSCHLFRHAMATHMLENGADIRYIQAMLGHSDLNTTQVYTQVSIRKLQEVHAATHPAKLEDKKSLLDQLEKEIDQDGLDS